ncbi:MAG: hypothetical protein GQ570_13005 [Helicobacteraceae bacterium]|nr:hypothetical protein [Helicobacteraceae bacterium]
MELVSKYQVLERASKHFSKAEYERALENYAIVLKDYPNSKEAHNCAILTEMAMSGELGAEALFDYYSVLRTDDSESADTIMEEIIESMDGSIEHLSDLFKEPLNERLILENGILYDDFQLLVQKNENFSLTFENIMFSTRVIISEKEDFIDFLTKLVDHNFNDMAMNYLENALNVFPNEDRLLRLLAKLAEKNL